MVFRCSRTLLAVGTGVTLLAAPARAQTVARSPQEVGQIIAAAWQAVVPLTQRFTNHSLAERDIRFDYARTLAAFGLVDDAQTRASLGSAVAFTAGTDSLLADCDQVGSKPCSRLGSSVYVSVEPISVSSKQATVSVSIVWATTMPSKRAFLSASSTEVLLSRSGSGPWRFVGTGRGVIS